MILSKAKQSYIKLQTINNDHIIHMNISRSDTQQVGMYKTDMYRNVSVSRQSLIQVQYSYQHSFSICSFTRILIRTFILSHSWS